MPIIKPISDLRNKSKQISKLVHRSKEPVFITKNGTGDMVLLSIMEYRKMISEKEIILKLFEAEEDLKRGLKPVSADKVFTRLKEEHFGKKKIKNSLSSKSRG